METLKAISTFFFPLRNARPCILWAIAPLPLAQHLTEIDGRAAVYVR